MQFPDALLSGKINLTITGNGSCGSEGEYFMPVHLRSERCVRIFFDSRKLMTVGDFCEHLDNNLPSNHPAIRFRTKTSDWCVFVETIHFKGVKTLVDYTELPKESLLLEIHPYILNNFKLVVSMTPKYHRTSHLIVEGDATPEHLMRSAKISSNSSMEEWYQNAVKEIHLWNKNEASVKARGEVRNEYVDESDYAFLQNNIARFEEHKLMAIRVHNDIQYTKSLRSSYTLK